VARPPVTAAEGTTPLSGWLRLYQVSPNGPLVCVFSREAAGMDVDFRLNGQVNPGMRFLIIDDSVTMRRIIANILVRLGYPDVVHAANGREALDRIATEAVDVVITDWYMPEMNGLDFVKTLRTTPATSHIPIVIVTANAASDDIQHALRLGVKGYVLKPFSVDTMKDKIDSLMAQLAPEPDADQPEAGQAEAGQAEARQAEAGQAEAGQAEAGQADSSAETPPAETAVESGSEPVGAAGTTEIDPLMEPEPDFDTPPELAADSTDEGASTAPRLAADAVSGTEPGAEIVA
jgi:two-component system, chemotaxis family, chemotaxis protein CheY